MRPPAPLGADVACLHAGSFALVSPRSAAALRDLFDGAGRDVLRSIDPNVRPAMAPSLQGWRDAVAAFAARANLIKVSEEDLRLLHGDEADCDSIAGAWLSDRCALVALTRGGRGASLFHRRHGRLDAAPPPVPIADTVGAGDAFQAALLAWIHRAGARTAGDLAGLSAEALRTLLDRAVTAGALACARPGADPPTATELASHAPRSC